MANFAIPFFVVAFGFSLWAASVGWSNGNLRGVEFRQAQTALSTYFIQKEHNYSLAYPTPVLGKPWSIPLEFPLYQWVVAKLSSVTGIGLTSVARLISLTCFYLCLPAIFMLLGEWKLSVWLRWLLLGLTVSSPFYIFYSRAFLMETMALLFSLWFLLGYVRWLRSGSGWWLMVATISGVGAGLVKVTTFMLYLAPAAVVTAKSWWESSRVLTGKRKWAQIARTAGRCVAALIVPFIATLGWIHFADVTKALNPNAQFLVSANLNDYNFGTASTRFSAEVWAGHWRIFHESLIWLPSVVLGGAMAAFFGKQWWGKVVFCLSCFLGIQILFPELYAWHDYYYVANGVFFLLALGLSAAGIFLDERVPRWAGMAVFILLLGGQAYLYHRQFYHALKAVSPEGDEMTRVLNHVTRGDDVLVIQGEDWNSMTPYYSRRRALMFRRGVDRNETEIRRAFENLKGESVGALILKEDFEKTSPLLKLAVERFHFHPEPMLKWRDHLIYFPEDRWDEVFDRFESQPFYGVDFLEGAQLGAQTFAGKWYEVSQIKRYRLSALKYMAPQPVRFFARFGLSSSMMNGIPLFGAHPETRLQFSLPAGSHHLRTKAGLSPGAYENVPTADASDGVQIELKSMGQNNGDRMLFSRYLNPHDNLSDRGSVPIEVDFELPSAGEVELSITAGPNGKDQRDWAYLCPLTID